MGGETGGKSLSPSFQNRLTSLPCCINWSRQRRTSTVSQYPSTGVSKKTVWGAKSHTSEPPFRPTCMTDRCDGRVSGSDHFRASPTDPLDSLVTMFATLPQFPNLYCKRDGFDRHIGLRMVHTVVDTPMDKYSFVYKSCKVLSIYEVERGLCRSN